MKYTYYVCPDCGSDNVYHVGYDDGCGDYGEELCEVWECGNCGYVGDIDDFDEKMEDENTDDSTTFLSS